RDRPASRPARHAGRGRGLRPPRRLEAGAHPGDALHRGVVRAGRHRGHPAYRIRRRIMAEAGKSNGTDPGTVTIGGTAYTIIDHEYDVVVVGAGGSGLRAT